MLVLVRDYVRDYAVLWLPAFLVTIGIWMGAIACVRSLARRARFMADAEETGRLALSLHRRCAVPALFLALAAAGARVASDPQAYLYARSSYAAGVALFALLVVHVLVGRSAKRVARGDGAVATTDSLLPSSH
jgi:hypothetical protein